jgi:hypothetical protein
MIQNYTRPQLLIRQELEQLTNPAVRSLHACVLGPQFDLFRYTQSAERAAMSGVAFAKNVSADPAARQLVPYEGLLATHVVDAAFVRLYAENLEGRYWNAASHVNASDSNLYDFILPSLAEANKIRVVRRGAVLDVTCTIYNQNYGYIQSVAILFGGSGYTPSSTFDVPITGTVAGTGGVLRLTSNASGVITQATVVAPGIDYTSNFTFVAPPPAAGANVGEATATLLPELHGRPVKAGDVIYATLGSNTVRRTVRSLEREKIAAHAGSDITKADQKFAPANTNPSQSDLASIGSLTAPAGWRVTPNHTSIFRVDMTNIGLGYTAAPTVTVTDPIPVAGDLAWPTQAAVLTASVDSAGTVESVTVENGGAGYFKGGLVAVQITNPGSGYSVTQPPTIQVSSPPAGGVRAAVTPVVSANGKITSYRITEPGAGYTSAPTLTVVGGGGSNAALVGVVNLGSVRGATVTNPGTDYTSVPSVDIAGAANGTALMKAVGTTTVAAGGTGYQVNDVLTLVDGAGASRVAAQFVVTAAAGGIVSAVSILTAGSYDSLPGAGATTTGGHGTGCTLTPKWGVERILITTPSTTLTVAPGITFSGGAGSGAAATALLAVPVAITFTANAGSGAAATPVILSQAEDWSGLVEGSIYNGQYAERYTLTVIRGSNAADEARVRVRSASGGFVAESVAATHYGFGYRVSDPSLGGLAMEILPTAANTALRLGDQFSFTVIGKYKPLELSASGQLINLTVRDAGTGYTDATDLALTISAPPTGGTQAEAVVTISSGAVTSVSITNPGSGYLVAPTVAMPAGAGTPASAALITSTISTPENSRDLALVQDRAYLGTGDTTYLVRVVRGAVVGNVLNSFVGAALEIKDSNGVDTVQTLENVQQGVQYPLGTMGLRFVLPVNLVGPSGLTSGTAATLGAITVDGDGGITSIAVTDGGSGYVVAPEIQITTSAGTGAYAVANVVNGAVQSISITSAGADYTAQDTATAEAPVTYQQGLRTGDVYYVHAVAEAQTGPLSTIVLNGQLADTSSWTEDDLELNRLNVDCRALFSGRVDPKRNNAPELAYEVGSATVGGILLRNTLQIQLTERATGYQWVTVENSTGAKLFAHWRGLVPATSSDGIALYQSETAILNAFGAADQDNPVCYGALMALRGGQGKAVYVGKLVSNDVDGYTRLLRQAERVDGIYCPTPMTLDLVVHDLVKAHVDAVSAEDTKLWRRAYVAVQSPGQYSVMALDSEGDNLVATVSARNGSNVRVYSEGAQFLTAGIRAGDLFRTAYAYNEWNEPTYAEYVVQTVLEEDELLLVSGPAAPISPAQKFEIWRPDTGVTQAEYAGSRATHFNDRRMICVWCDGPLKSDANGDYQAATPYYLAAEIAGLRSAVLPQQGLTYTELQYSVDAAPTMFTKYTQAELNLAAAKGAMVVTQEFSDTPVFIRHQLTTATNFGSLYYEDSVGTNLDAIAYGFKDMFQPYIGKRNATRETLEEISTKARDLLGQYMRNPGGFTKIGPALVSYSGLKVSIDPVLKDKVLMEVTLELPLPINTMLIVLRATTIQGDIVITTATPSVTA